MAVFTGADRIGSSCQVTTFTIGTYQFNDDFWSSQAGKNNYPERMRRLQLLCKIASKAGIAVSGTSCEILDGKNRWLQDYDEFKTALAERRVSETLRSKRPNLSGL